MNLKKRFLAKMLLGIFVLTVLVGTVKQEILAATVPTYHDIPAYQQRNIFETEKESISGIKVEELVNGGAKAIQRPVEFKIFNTVTQELEATVKSENGVLPTLNLKKNHNYMIYAVDSEYTMVPPAFGWVKDGKLLNIKKNVSRPYNYPTITNLQLSKRKEVVENPENDRRCLINLDIKYADGPMANVTFKLISDVETIEVKSTEKGKLRADLLEEVTYMVTVDHKDYTVDPFPIAIKDKSEYKDESGKPGVRYSYDHSDCKLVETIQLINKADAHKNDKIKTSLSGNTTVGGFNFKDLIIVDRNTNIDLGDEWKDKKYDVVDIKAVNPHRWEISKLAAGEFQVTEKINDNQIVEQVYYLGKENELHEIDFSQNENQVDFTMSSISLYPVVIEYNAEKSTLNAMIKEASGLEEDDYTAETWNQYLSEVSNAEQLLNQDSSQEEVQGAINAISEAKEKLTHAVATAPSKEELHRLIAIANSRNASAYTVESWIPYIEEIRKAKELVEDENATNKACKEEINAIKNVEKGLVLAPIKVSGININGSSHNIAAGKSIQLTTEIIPANAENKSVQWRSSNSKYAVVSTSGKVTTKKAGAGKAVNIIAEATDGSGKVAAFQIKIMKHAVKSIKLTAKSSVKAGKSVKVKAKVKTTGKNVNKKLTWKTSNTNYATVSSNGKVVAKKAGKGKTVKITARATDGSGKSKTVKIKIK